MRKKEPSKRRLSWGRGGQLHVTINPPGTVWLHTPAGLIGFDVCGPTPEVVVYGKKPIKIRRAGLPLDSALLYHPVSNQTQPVAGARDFGE